MYNYRRSQKKGGTFFFTLALANRQSRLLVEHIDYFKQDHRKVWQQDYPFESLAVCVLPEHLHAVWSLPTNDCNYSLRWRLIKRYFSYHFKAVKTRSDSKIKHREKGIWQRRFWEHEIRNEADLHQHIDYVHLNPVKHGYVKMVGDWRYSSFHRYVCLGLLPENLGSSAELLTKNWD